MTIKITIDAAGRVYVDGRDTIGLHRYTVIQLDHGTCVFRETLHTDPVNPRGHSYWSRDTVRMPATRYALSCDAPASGVPGRAEFERDFAETL